MQMKLIDRILEENGRIHFIGIGGIMMSVLALELKRRGANVSGSDRDMSETVSMLISNGIPVQHGHMPEVIDGASLIVRNAAIKDDFPDIVRARELGIPVMERPELLGLLMKDYACPICVAGTHGKSTTSAMLTSAMMAAGCDPTAFLGAVLPEIGGAYTLGAKDYFVAESCEYRDSFLNLFPRIAVILNVEEDHLDYFSGIDHIVSSFARFGSLVGKDGCVVYNADNQNAVKAANMSGRKTVGFGVENGEYRAMNVSLSDGYPKYELFKNGVHLADISLSIPGMHNVFNSLAVAAAMDVCGIAPSVIASGIKQFGGVLRRFQRVGELNGADVIDDYAHHPDELKATINTARSMGDHRVVCCFQPHTYTRTAALLDDFVQALSLADKVIVTDIFAAREKNTVGITSEDITDRIDNSEYIPSLEGCEKRLRELVRAGDIVLVCGAGSITKVAKNIVK